MKTKKDLEKRIEELELLVKQKDDIIALLNQQYQNNVPDNNFGCLHDWQYDNSGTAGQTRTCRKCGIWELIQSPYYGTPTTPIPPFTVGDDPNYKGPTSFS
jgi:hypothetical protein